MSPECDRPVTAPPPQRGGYAPRTILLILASLAVVACGRSAGGSSEATTLLEQTFGATHTVTSGTVRFSLAILPVAPAKATAGIGVSVGGPFEGRGAGRLPASNFTITLSHAGQRSTIAILSTGTRGYLTFQGASYELPAASFHQLESGFAAAAASAGTGSGAGAGSGSGSGAGTGSGVGAGTIAKLGIHPLAWLVHPAIVGTETVGGASTTHIRAGVDVAVLLSDVNTVLRTSSSLKLGTSGQLPGGISSVTRQRVAAEVRDATADVWTGTVDRTIRKLTVGLTAPVSGQLRAFVGGGGSASFRVTLQYDNLNRPQSIAAPTRLRPIGELASQLQSPPWWF